MAEPLHRSRDDRMLAGVAAGVAETFGADPSIVRIVWALLAVLTGGVALVVYVVMAIVVPQEPDDLETPVEASEASGAAGASWASPAPSGAAPVATGAPPEPPPGLPAPATPGAERAARRAARRAGRRESADSGGAALIFGVVLIAIGGFFLLRQVLPWFGFHLVWPLAIVALGVLLLVVALRPGRPPG